MHESGYLISCGFCGGFIFFFSSRIRHTICHGDWSSDVCSSDLPSRIRYDRRTVLDEILAYLKQPFVVLSGTPVTALSIVTAIGIVIVSRIVAGIVARSVGRVFVARGAE